MKADDNRVDLDQTEIDWNPVAVEQALWELKNRIAKGVMVVDKSLETFQDAEEIHDTAEAKAYIGFDSKPAHERKYHVYLDHEVTEARIAMKIAERVFKRATLNMKALTEGLGAVRSIGAGVRQAYDVAGVGER